METISNPALVQKQYATTGNLRTRISIHSKYSTNPQGFGNWIFSQYHIAPGSRVLELGCGTGEMWRGRDDLIVSLQKLVLSDFSPAMVAESKRNVGHHANLEYRCIDIQQIPCAAGSFDVVIANMMLYHVPDLDWALTEVRRVLTPDGIFYCATYGENGIISYLSRLLAPYGVEDNLNKSFTLQNGEAILSAHFSHVERQDYPDSLAVTDLGDMVDYIYSLSSMTALSAVPKADIRQLLQAHMADGVLHVPKEYGMFQAR